MAGSPLSSSSVRSDSTHQSYPVALATATSLFFMWGFITCLNDILLPHLKAVFDLSYVQAALIQFTFFTAYFVMAIPAGSFIARFGLQRGIVTGLLMSGIGTLLFIPAALLVLYPLFLGGLFIIASGFTLLQVAANPYVSVLGKPETASSRLNLAGGFNSVGTAIAPYLGGLFILSATALKPEAIQVLSIAEQTAYRLQEAASVKVPYLILTAMLIGLAIIMWRVKLPVVQSIVAEHNSMESYRKALSFRQLRLGAIGIFMYVGAEVTIGTFLVNFLGLPAIAGLSEQSAATFVAYYWSGAMIGRFSGSYITTRFRSQNVLAVASIINIVLVVTAVLSHGTIAMWSLIAVGLFNSIMWPCIFTLGIHGLGTYTNQGSSILVMNILGGAVIPVIHGKLADVFGLHLSYILPAFCYGYILWYALRGQYSREELSSVPHSA